MLNILRLMMRLHLKNIAAALADGPGFGDIGRRLAPALLAAAAAAALAEPAAAPAPDPIEAFLAGEFPEEQGASAKAPIDAWIENSSAEPSGYYGRTLADLQAGRPAAETLPAGALRPALPEAKAEGEGAAGAAAASETSKAGGKTGEAASEPSPGVEISLKEAGASLTRESDGGIVIADADGFSLVGFYGYGGLEKGSGYRFIGTGYAGIDGTSRVIPASLLLAGFTADPRQNIYSAEMRAELPIPLTKEAELVPFAGFRTVLTQNADSGLGATSGGTSAGESDRRSVQQIPMGVGVRVTRQVDPRTRYRLKSQVGAVANMGDTGTVQESEGYRGYSGSSITGIGSIGIEVESGDWTFGAGADIGVTTDDRTEKGLSVNIRHTF